MNKEQIDKLRVVCKNISVLYVEDDPNIAMQVEKMLRKIFTHVDVQSNGLLGLKSYMKKRQEIVITDISMPSMDGIEMSKNIRLINPEQNILITSAHNDIEYLMALIELGVDKFLTKPIDMGKFLGSISKIAIGIYREKREALLEQKLTLEQNLQAKIIDALAYPLAYFEQDRVLYANDSFREHFFTKIDTEDKNNFRLGYLFEEKRFVSLQNSALLDALEQKSTKVFELLDVKKKYIKKYHITIVPIAGTKQRLVSLVNLDDMNMELGRFKSQTDYFPKRDAFTHAVMEQKEQSQQNYYLFCIGLRNTSRFISKFGGTKMHEVYKNFAYCLKKEFLSEVERKLLSIYLFETNRYIFLVDESIAKNVEKSIYAFGGKYSYEFGSKLSFDLNVTKDEIQHSKKMSEVLENAEGMLYTFDD